MACFWTSDSAGLMQKRASQLIDALTGQDNINVDFLDWKLVDQLIRYAMPSSRAMLSRRLSAVHIWVSGTINVDASK